MLAGEGMPPAETLWSQRPFRELEQQAWERTTVGQWETLAFEVRALICAYVAGMSRAARYLCRR
jgi:hypothetical protein